MSGAKRRHSSFWFYVLSKTYIAIVLGLNYGELLKQRLIFDHTASPCGQKSVFVLQLSPLLAREVCK
jgi:hypothetical protein